MSLITVQQALARIYTDSKLRDDFLSNPDVVGKTLKLNCPEIQQLSKLSSREVNMYASSLKYKRLGEARKLLPLTTKALGNKLNQLFFQYAETYLLKGNKKHLQDAIAFTEFILNIVKEDVNPNWLSDIVEYEQIWLKALDSQKLFMVNHFNYPIRLLIDSLQTTDFAPKLKPKANITVWFRLSQKHKWHHLTVPIIRIQSIKLKIFQNKIKQVS